MKRLRDIFAPGTQPPDNSERVHILDPTPRGPREGSIAIVAIYRNEAHYIEEWIAYHRLIGVEKFFLYDNDTTDDTNARLRPHVESGLVEIMPWPHFLSHTNTQAAAYAHAISRLAGRYDWLSMIDIDEFLVPVRGERLPEILKDYAAFPSVLLHWYMFGPSGHRTRPEAGVIASYTRRQKTPQEGSRADAAAAKRTFKTKYLVQPQLARQFVGTHIVGTTALPLTGHDDLGKPLHEKDGAVGGTRLRINHYFTRSLAELEAKLAMPRIAKPGARRSASRMEEVLAGFVENNCVEDRVIIDLVARLGAPGKG